MRVALGVIVCAAVVWALWVATVGGVDVTLLGLRLRSNRPDRPLVIAAVAFAGYLLAGGRVPVKTIARAIANRPGWIAIAIAIAATTVAWVQATRVAGGADAYGYVSQAELWRNGTLTTPQPWADVVPWPNAVWTFSPLGYRPATEGAAIVPTYSPGLPILMALAKTIGGHCAIFAIVPLSLGLAALATYGLGTRLGSRLAGVIAAALVVTSPVVLEVALESLTDVPAMTAWSIAFYFLLGRRRGQALAAGAAASVAILIRPNLVPLAIPMAAWFLIRRAPAPIDRRNRWVDAAIFLAGLAPGVVATALINAALYGSPATSGYGSVSSIYAWAHVMPNLRHFVSWIVATQTPLALIGLAALVVPLPRLWPGVSDCRVFIVIGAYVLLLWAQYAAYLEFDSAGYLRFLLASWPFMLLGVAATLLAIARLRPATAGPIVAAAVVALCIWQVRTAIARDVFLQQQAAQHEIPLSRLVRAHTEDRSVILAVGRSGSLRYYAGRMTVRYDILEPAWLDRSVDWLAAKGVRTYALLDEREVGEVRRRFTGASRLEALGRPLLVYEPAGTALYDLTSLPTAPPIVISTRQPSGSRCDPPVAPPVLDVR